MLSLSGHIHIPLGKYQSVPTSVTVYTSSKCTRIEMNTNVMVKQASCACHELPMIDNPVAIATTIKQHH